MGWEKKWGLAQQKQEGSKAKEIADVKALVGATVWHVLERSRWCLELSSPVKVTDESGKVGQAIS